MCLAIMREIARTAKTNDPSQLYRDAKFLFACGEKIQAAAYRALAEEKKFERGAIVLRVR